jgi:ERCC4-type nuclease
MSFNVIVDTREQTPFDFASSSIDSVLFMKLDTGDYSIEGLEDKLAIERKGSVSEFYGNITEKRFWKEMDRMQKYPYKFIIFEFSVSDVEMFPYGSGLPKSVMAKLKITPAYLMKCIAKIQVKYGIHVVFGETRDNSIYLVPNIMKEVYDTETNSS